MYSTTQADVPLVCRTCSRRSTGRAAAATEAAEARSVLEPSSSDLQRRTGRAAWSSSAMTQSRTSSPVDEPHACGRRSAAAKCRVDRRRRTSSSPVIADEADRRSTRRPAIALGGSSSDCLQLRAPPPADAPRVGGEASRESTSVTLTKSPSQPGAVDVLDDRGPDEALRRVVRLARLAADPHHGADGVADRRLRCGRPG